MSVTVRAMVVTFAACGGLVLAGCSSGTMAPTTTSTPISAASVDAGLNPSTPASADVPAAAALTTAFDGMAQPAGFPDDIWANAKDNYVITTDLALADLTPDELSRICVMDRDMLEAEFGNALEYGSDSAETVGFGTPNEWATLWVQWLDNTRQIACEMSK